MHEKGCMKFILRKMLIPELITLLKVHGILYSGVAGAFPGGRLAHPKGQNEEENKQSLRKNWSKFEESETLAHPGLWGWLRPWVFILNLLSFLEPKHSQEVKVCIDMVTHYSLKTFNGCYKLGQFLQCLVTRAKTKQCINTNFTHSREDTLMILSKLCSKSLLEVLPLFRVSGRYHIGYFQFHILCRVILL